MNKDKTALLPFRPVNEMIDSEGSFFFPHGCEFVRNARGRCTHIRISYCDESELQRLLRSGLKPTVVSAAD